LLENVSVICYRLKSTPHLGERAKSFLFLSDFQVDVIEYRKP